MPRRAAPSMAVLWLIALAGAAPADEATTTSSAAADPSKLTAGAVLMSDYIYRGISSHKR
jgi:hypothetical protein